MASRAAVEISNAALFELGRLIRFPHQVRMSETRELARKGFFCVKIGCTGRFFLSLKNKNGRMLQTCDRLVGFADGEAPRSPWRVMPAQVCSDADPSASYLAATVSDWPFFKRVSPDCLAERIL